MKVVLSQNGYKIPVIAGKPLHSRIDPLREGAVWAREVEPRKTVVALGLGFGYHLAELGKQSCRVVVVEPDEELVRRFEQEKPVEFSFPILTGKIPAVLKELEKFLDKTSDWRDVELKVHQASLRLRPGLYRSYQDALNWWLEQRLLNLITDSSFGPLWTRNCLNHYRLSLPVPRFENRKNSPVAVLGSGYSLLEALPFLKRNRDKLILLAIPPVLEVLEYHHIQPDGVLLVDPGHANRYYLKSLSVPLLTYLSGSSLFTRHWKGPVYFLNSAMPLEEFLIPDFPRLPVSGSVASTALDLASSLSSQVLFAGFDFGFVRGYYHYPGNPLERELSYHSRRTIPLENRFLELLRRGQKLQVPASKPGTSWSTNLSMHSYYLDFCAKMGEWKKKGRQFYVLSRETAWFPEAEYGMEDQKRMPSKDFAILSQQKNEEEKRRKKLRELLRLYREERTEHPLLRIHLTRFLLKKDEEGAREEMKRTVCRIERILKREE